MQERHSEYNATKGKYLLFGKEGYGKDKTGDDMKAPQIRHQRWGKKNELVYEEGENPCADCKRTHAVIWKGMREKDVEVPQVQTNIQE